MKKRTLSVVLVLSMIVSFMPIIASAYYGTKYGDYLYYNVYESRVTISDCDEAAVSVSIPSTIDGLPVTSIGRAFGECSSLTSVTIPSSVTSIDSRAFDGCSSLTDINVNSSNQSYKSIDGVIFSKDSKKLEIYPQGKKETSYTVPYGTTSIETEAFYGCSNLTSIIISDGVTSIGNQAFAKCTGLTNITIPDSVTIIDKRAFSGCSKLSNIIIPNSVKTIGNEAFEDCKNLKNITLPDTMEEIGGAAFVGCSSLTSITLPYGITGLFNGAEGGLFQDCSSLKSIIIPDSVTEICLAAFWGCSSLTSITIPKSVTEISSDAFQYCSSLKDVYYTGTKEEWDKMDIKNSYNGNDDLLNATIHYNSATPSTIYSADKVSTQITSGKLKITLNVDDNINNATVYVAFRNNGKIADVKKTTLSNLKAEVSLSNKTYTDMNIYIWNSRQQPYTYVKNIKK